MKKVFVRLFLAATLCVAVLTGFVAASETRMEDPLYSAGNKNQSDPNICNCPITVGNCVCRVT